MSDLGPSPKLSSADDPSFKAIFVGVGLFAAAILALVSAVGRALLFGWFFFLDRNLATFQPDWPTLWLGLCAFAILFVTVHQMARRSATGPASNSSATKNRWTWRSTTASCLAIVLLFAASVAMVASLHQLIWLASGSQSKALHASKWNRPQGSFSMVAQLRRQAWKTQSKNNIKQMMLGLHNYADVYSTFPPGAIMLPDGRGYRGWIAPLGPYIGFNDQWSWHNPSGWDDPGVADLGKGAIPVLMHPELGWQGQFDERGFALMHYAGNVHVFPNNVGMSLSKVSDGTSNTLAVGETAENFQPWASPWNRRDPSDGINDVPWGFGGPPWQHGAQFGFMDGSVRLLSRNIDRTVLKALGTPAGGERIDEDALR